MSRLTRTWASRNLWAVHTSTGVLIATITLALAGCGGQGQTSTGTAQGGPPASRQPSPPVPVPVAAPQNPAAIPAGISGNYMLYRHLTSCTSASKFACSGNPMDVRIACTANACTITRTNSSSGGEPPWSRTIPITYNGTAWTAQGHEQNASECDGKLIATTSVQFMLEVDSGSVVNGIWKAQQLMGTYTVAQGPTKCDNYGSGLGVYAVSTLDLSSWPLSAELTQVEKIAGFIWQVVDTGETICEITLCKLAETNVAKVISAVSKVKTIGSLAEADRQVVILGQDTAALNAMLKGHVKGAPLSPQVKLMLKKVYTDGYDLLQDINEAAGISQLWHPLPPPPE